MAIASFSETRRSIAIDALIVGAVGAVVLALTWNRWCDPIIDVGRDLYIPEQLLRGTVLYRDILYYYPPLPPYLLALVTAVIGHSLAAYTAICIAQASTVAALLYATARRLSGRAPALAVALAFVLMNLCASIGWGTRWMFPYAFAATFGMMFLLAMFTAAAFERPRLAVAFALLAAWCKIECVVIAAVVLAALAYTGRLRARYAVSFGALYLVTVAAMVAIFGAGPLRQNVLPESLLRGAQARYFYDFVSGGGFWRAGLQQALVAGVLLVPIAWLIRRKRRTLAAIVAVLVAFAVPYAAAMFRLCGYLQWLALTRRREAWLFALAVFSVVATLRIRYNVVPSWYGAILILPLYLLIAHAIRNEHVWLVLLVGLSLRTFLQDRPWWNERRYPIATKRGVILDWNGERAAVLNAAIPMLRGSVAVFPEGLTLNYFAGVPTTLRYQTFTPVETADAATETAVIDDLVAHPPEQVVVLTRDVSEFGSRGFGVDYDQRLVAAIRARYVVQAAWRRPQFGLLLFRRAR